MPSYYFIGTLLPDLSLGMQPEISFDELKALLNDNLSRSHLAQIKVIRLLYDILNIRSLWLGETLDRHANYTKNELEDALIGQMGLPNYVFEFLDKHDSQTERLRHFSDLIAKFFRFESVASTGFLHDYLTFEREWRLIFTVLRAKKLRRDLLVELQYEDPEEGLVAQIISQKDAKSYEPPEKYQGLKNLFEDNYDAPLGLEKAICEYRFNYIDQLIGMDVFTIRRILAFVAQYIIVEKWFELDKKKGTEIIDNIVKEIS